MEWIGIICMTLIVSCFSLLVGLLGVLGIILATKAIIRELRKKKIGEGNR